MADWYFRNNQQNRLKPCPGCKNLVSVNAEFCPYCARRLRAEGGARGWVKNFLNRPDVATRSLLGLIGVAFILQIVADMVLPDQFKLLQGRSMGFFSLLASDPMTYIRLGSNFQYLVAVKHEYWRFVTYCFLHAGLLHIAFNSWAFWDLGRLAERLWGARQVFATFILTGIAGAASSYAWGLTVSGFKNSLGASGAICGILGLLLGAYYRNRYQIGTRLGSQLFQWAVYVLVFGLVAGADNAAHIGGLLSGAILGYFLPPTNHSRSVYRDAKIWDAAAILSLVLLIVSLVFAVKFFAMGPQYAYNLLPRMY